MRPLVCSAQAAPPPTGFQLRFCTHKKCRSQGSQQVGLSAVQAGLPPGLPAPRRRRSAAAAPSSRSHRLLPHACRRSCSSHATSPSPASRPFPAAASVRPRPALLPCSSAAPLPPLCAAQQPLPVAAPFGSLAQARAAAGPTLPSSRATAPRRSCCATSRRRSARPTCCGTCWVLRCGKQAVSAVHCPWTARRRLAGTHSLGAAAAPGGYSSRMLLPCRRGPTPRLRFPPRSTNGCSRPLSCGWPATRRRAPATCAAPAACIARGWRWTRLAAAISCCPTAGVLCSWVLRRGETGPTGAAAATSARLVLPAPPATAPAARACLMRLPAAAQPQRRAAGAGGRRGGAGGCGGGGRRRAARLHHRRHPAGKRGCVRGRVRGCAARGCAGWMVRVCSVPGLAASWVAPTAHAGAPPPSPPAPPPPRRSRRCCGCSAFGRRWSACWQRGSSTPALLTQTTTSAVWPTCRRRWQRRGCSSEVRRTCRSGSHGCLPCPAKPFCSAPETHVQFMRLQMHAPLP